MAKQYRIKSGGGGLYAGQVVSEDEFLAIHPDVQRKMLAKGDAVEVKSGESTVQRDADQQAQVNDIERQIAELTAKRSEMLGEVVPNQTVEFPPRDEIDPAHQAMVKAAGREAIQPTAGDPNVGEVVDLDPAVQEAETERISAMEEAAREKARQTAREVKAGRTPMPLTPDAQQSNRGRRP